MTLRIKNNSMRVVYISKLDNFKVSPNTTVDAPSGYLESEIIVALEGFVDLTLLGTTVMTTNTYDTDRNNIVDSVDNSGSPTTLDATDITYTPTTPSNFPVVPTNAQEALDTLSQDIHDIGSGDVGGIVLGTTDAFGRHQIWNKLVNGVLRLGSLSGDGDPTDVTSEGIVSYGLNASELPMTGSDFGYARIKPYRFGLYDSTNGGFVGYIFEFNTHNDVWYICDNLGNHLFEFDRSSGSFKCTSLNDGVNTATVSDIKSAIDLKHDGSNQLSKNGIDGSFTVSGVVFTVVDGQITNIV